MSIPIKCFPLSGSRDYAVEDFQNYLAMRTAGVFGVAGNLEVTPQATPDMTINVAKGVAWLIIGEMAGVSAPVRYPKILTVSPSDIINARIDSVVLGVDKTTGEGYLKIATGEWGGSAPAPVRDETAFELVLAHISIPANCTAISAEQITDMRADSSVCGYMTEGTAIVADLVTSGVGIMSASLGRVSEGHTAEMPAEPATCALFFDVDMEQMFFYSKILGRWIPQ